MLQLLIRSSVASTLLPTPSTLCILAVWRENYINTTATATTSRYRQDDNRNNHNNSSTSKSIITHLIIIITNTTTKTTNSVSFNITTNQRNNTMDSSIFAVSSSTLVPLMQVHRVLPIFRMLQALPWLQIWTVPISYLSPADHVLLEDAASCYNKYTIVSSRGSI
jgi:hypothetical protein